VTNADGRTDAPLVHGRPVPVATYELRVRLGDYHRRLGLDLPVDPGRHEVRVRRGDAVCGSEARELRPGGRATIELRVFCAAVVTPTDPRTHAPSGGSADPAPFVALGIGGGVVLAGAIVLGVVLLSALVALLRGFRWRELFVERRSEVQRSMRFLVFGHGLLDKARAPFIGLTAHALVLDVPEALMGQPAPAIAATLDQPLAGLVDTLASPRDLAPLPVLGIPGWWPANEDPVFYDNARYFRPGRHG
jgi:hypothetical protein